MDAIILAGGKGTRMNSHLPKPLVEVKGKPILAYQLDYLLKSKEIKKIILSVGYKAEEIMRYVNSHYSEHVSTKIVFSVEEQQLGTAGGIKIALPKTDTDHVLILNCDDITDIPISTLAKIKEDTICVAHPKLPFGSVTEEHGYAHFIEKPVLDSWVSCGWYVFNKKELLKHLPGKGSLEHDVFPKIRMRLFRHEGFWGTFNTEKDIKSFEEKALPSTLRNSK